jgi:NTE family protein
MAKKVGLALSGGGARGFAHVGVLQALVENDIPIDLIAGTSAGSFVGGAYAAGLTVDEIVEIGKKISWFGVAGFSYSPKGFLSNAPMKGFIEKSFPVTRFEDLKIPFTAVACDLETGEEIYLKDDGDLTHAIRASCAIPGVFVPVTDDGRQLVDGGVVSPIPTRAVKKMGAEVIIAVDLITCGTTYWGSPSTLVGTFFQSAMIMLRTTSRHQHYRADLIIEPAISHIRPDEIAKRDELVELGYKSVVDSIEDIRKAIEAN